MAAIAVPADFAATAGVASPSTAGEPGNRGGTRRTGKQSSSCSHLTTFFETREGDETLAVVARLCVENGVVGLTSSSMACLDCAALCARGECRTHCGMDNSNTPNTNRVGNAETNCAFSTNRCRGVFLQLKRRDLFCATCDAEGFHAGFDKAVLGAIELTTHSGGVSSMDSMGKQSDVDAKQSEVEQDFRGSKQSDTKREDIRGATSPQETAPLFKKQKRDDADVCVKFDETDVTSLPNVDAFGVPRGVRGVVNLGNTCFMTTVVQALVRSPSVGGFFLRDGHCRALCLARRLEDLERRKKKQQSPAASFPQEEKGEKEKEEPFLDPGGSCLPCELDFLVSEFYGNGCGVGSSTGSNTAVTTAGTTAGNTASTTVVPTSNTPAGAPIVPSKFLHAWWQVAPKHLAGQGQQDAHEFFIHLVSAAHLGFKKETVREAGEKNTGLVLKKDDHAARVGSIPGGDVVSPPTFQTETHTKEKDTDITKCPCPMHRAFAGTLRSDVTCGSCQVVSTAFDETVGLSLDVPNGGSRSLPKAVTLEQCFAKFIRPERLSDDLNSGGGSSFRCPSCGDSKSKKTKQMSVRTFPRTLVTHVKRFARGQKIHTHVQFPFTLDVNPYSSSFAERDRARFRGIHGTRHDSSDPSDPAAQQNEASKFMYELFAVIVHSGNLDSGHYFAYVRSQNAWFRCDDSRVTRAEPVQVAAAQAYLLFYHRT